MSGYTYMMRKVWQTRLHIVHIFTHHNRHIYHYRVGIISLNTHINLLLTIKRREYTASSDGDGNIDGIK